MVNIDLDKKDQIKKAIREVLSSIVDIPNKDILSVTANFDPSLNTIKLSYYSLSKDCPVVVFDEFC